MSAHNSITWAVCKNEGTATIFCMHCREQLKTVEVGEAAFHLDEFKASHSCVSKTPWKVRQK